MKRKIIIHTGNLSIGGQEKMTMEFLKILSPQKYDVKLLIEEDKGSENYYEKEIPKYVKYDFLTSKKFMDKVLSQKKSRSILDKIKYSINLRRKKNIAMKKFNKEIKGADLIIDYNLGLLRNIHKLKDKKIPIIGWSHLGNGTKQKRKQKEENMMKYDAIVTINEEMENGFKNNYGKKGLDIFKIDNFIDEELVFQKSQVSYNEKLGTYILSIGALTERKNYIELIRAFSKYISLENSDINLVIIGDGDQKSLLENEIEKLNLKNRVFLLGRKINPYPYIKNSELFILPSKAEGFPVVLMEAMTLGKLVIGKINSGNVEVLKNGKYGILLDNLENELPKVLNEIFRDENFRRKYELLSLERARDFSKEKARENIETLLISYL